MTMMHFRLTDPSGIPLDGYVSLVPTRRVTVGDEVRLPTAVRVPLQDGEATVDMLPSTTQWVWRVAELVKGGITRYVAVPDSDTVVEYAVLESVDPSSLDVSSASVPAWEIATRTAQEMLDKVGEIDGKVERAEDAAAGAESSAGAAESHESAARSSADAAASSARDAASSATAAASSAGSAASSASAAASSASDAASSAGEASGSAEAAAGSVSTAASHATAAAQSATAAAKSVAEAASSASAASSAEQAASIVASVSGSVAQAENAARSASQSATAAAGSASAAGGSAQAAADSASKAGESATAAGTSERNAASSAAQAAQSATAAAQSASEAQNAVDGFGLEVGTTTTGEPGTDAAVSIAKQGTKYVADFTIPRGEKGEQGASGINSVLTNTTLTGDGTSSSPLGISPGTFINPILVSGDGADANLVERGKIYLVNRSWKNLPKLLVNGYLFYGSDGGSANFQFLFAYTDDTGGVNAYIRQSWGGFITSSWHRLIRDSDLSNYVPLSTYQALETRVQALEAKLSNQ
ncbi:hypothetical protein [Bifidobacterium pullorum]|uniref:hypothetical protein n=1 Tax=Bifidobacterium pullorum TaxID=78448 RepID=UPI00242C00AC|nr:hypothetical protein [Bifidobacterium pullorum]